VTNHWCLWCDAPFKPRTNGGKAQRFCRALCRKSFYSACRAWAVQAVFEGALSLEAIRKASPSTCTLATARSCPSGLGGAAHEAIASPTTPQRLAAHIANLRLRRNPVRLAGEANRGVFGSEVDRKTESRCCSGPVRVLDRC
jgi:hypothetical protein